MLRRSLPPAAAAEKEAAMYFIGIDLGTSACKLLLVDEAGAIVNEVTHEYPLIFPHPGWSEQKPEDWWSAVVTGVPELLRGFDASEVAGIGSGGQMHGLVALDEADNVIRPAILWNDGRTSKEVDYLNNVVGKDKLSSLTANIAFAGFTAPKLLWMRENEPENFKKIAKIMLPKDYLTYKLTGVHACDSSDASGMLLLDVQHKCWSKEMLDICGVSESQMPQLFESFAVVGTLTKEAAQTLGLPETVKVVAGAGDNAAAAVGTGTVGAGGCNISLGTSGTIFISSGKFGVDPNNALHAFAHADGGYHLMGCMLSAASCNKWLCEEILKTSDFAGEQADITDEKLGENHVYFLPYLMGERSPINDTNARGTFTGMTMDTSRSDMVQAFSRAWRLPSATRLRSRSPLALPSRARTSAAAARRAPCGAGSSPTSSASPSTWSRPSRAPATARRCWRWSAAAGSKLYRKQPMRLSRSRPRPSQMQHWPPNTKPATRTSKSSTPR